MEVVIRRDYEQMSATAAQLVIDVLNTKPNAVLGMATGSTPLGLYQELVRLHEAGEVDFSRVTTFNLDEYVGLPANHPQSYHYFMHEHFFQHVNIPRHNINIPSGTTSNYPAFCQWYEGRIAECGGIDLQILGIGTDGHIAFNEPGSSLSSRTRLKTLSKQTIDDNARFFELRDHDGRRDDPRCAAAGAGGERQDQGQGDRPGRRGTRHQHGDSECHPAAP